MQKGIIGKKIGMTQIFDENGKVVPVTVVEAGPCVVSQKKTVENDGYAAVQIGFGDLKAHKVKKPMAGHFAKANVAPKRTLREFQRLKDSHGSGPVARHGGSIGSCSDPSRVYPGKKMAGHLGSERVTVQNLQVVKVDAENNLIAIKGAIPGPNGGTVVIHDTVKA